MRRLIERKLHRKPDCLDVTSLREFMSLFEQVPVLAPAGLFRLMGENSKM